MNRISTARLWILATVFGALALLLSPSVVRGQGDLIGSRGGQLASAPFAGSTGSLFQGLNLGSNSIQNGLGPNVSSLAQNGTHGQQLASMVHDLQASRRSNDIREDRREIRGDERRVRDDQRQLARDRQDLQRDLQNGTNQRDIREDRKEVRQDEQRLRSDERQLNRDRQDLQRDQRDQGNSRDIREDRKEVRGDEQRVRQDERQLNRDRQDLQRDQQNGASQRDIREDRKEIRQDEQRLRGDEHQLSRDRADLQRDMQNRGNNTPLNGSTGSHLSNPTSGGSNVLNGLNSSGTATRHGLGGTVSDMTHQGVHGQQLSGAIHQLQPLKEKGVLQGNQPAVHPNLPFQPGNGGIMQNIRGRGKGKG
ncbi:MAG: hypothetical protein ACJ8F7_10440 [Gemmataceae bacterium]